MIQLNIRFKHTSNVCLILLNIRLQNSNETQNSLVFIAKDANRTKIKSDTNSLFNLKNNDEVKEHICVF